MATVNWDEPTNSKPYDTVLSSLTDRSLNAAIMDFSGDSNKPTGLIQWDNTNRNFERWNGTSWDLVNPVVPNDTWFQIANSGGTAQNILKVDTSSDLNINGPNDIKFLCGGTEYFRIDADGIADFRNHATSGSTGAVIGYLQIRVNGSNCHLQYTATS